jgi:hypothetical protein
MFYLLEADESPALFGRVLSRHESLALAHAAHSWKWDRASKLGTSPPSMCIVESVRNFRDGENDED